MYEVKIAVLAMQTAHQKGWVKENISLKKEIGEYDD
jgi:hypothetical protein